MARWLAGWALALGLATAAHAVPVQWTLDNVAFDDGGTASGSFVYDADTQTYSNIQVSTTSGTSLGSATFAAPCTAAPCTAAPGLVVLSESPTTNDLTNVRLLVLQLSLSSLPAAPATLPLAAAREGICPDANCTGSVGEVRSSTGGSLVGALFVATSAVPTLTEWALALLAVALALVAARRARSRPV